MFVDVHSHLYFKDFDKDRDDVIKRAEVAGVVTIINAGVDHASNLAALSLAEKYPVVKATLGIYPTEVAKMSDKALDDEIAFIRKQKNNIIGVGEVGLDFKETTDEEGKQKQIAGFKKILTSLEDLDMPFIIHSRKAERECIDILEELKIKKVNFHCFCGKFKLVKRIEENGWTASLPANIDKSQQFQGVAELLSIGNILTETDAPYLTPRGELRSEPSFIPETIKTIATIKKMDVSEVQKNIFLNYQRLFM